jgi:hypothetical protein
MKDHGSVTPWEAMQNLGVYRLGARIYDLKKSGIAIRTEIKEVRSRNGTARVACYSLA